MTAHKSNISTFYHETTSQSQLGIHSDVRYLLQQARIAFFSIIEHTMQLKAVCHNPSVMLTLIRLT